VFYIRHEYWADGSKDSELRATCSVFSGNEYRIVGKSMNGADYLADLGVDGMIILNATSGRLNSTHSRLGQ
jgi:hypothetical protein